MQHPTFKYTFSSKNMNFHTKLDQYHKHNSSHFYIQNFGEGMTYSHMMKYYREKKVNKLWLHSQHG